MKYLVTVLLAFGCGEEFVEVQGDCQPYSDSYSHTVIYCGEPTQDNVENVFTLCNPRIAEPQDCVEDLALMNLADDCFAANVCWSVQ
jgi:hypothetical protein